jgi:hypothetical protein
MTAWALPIRHPWLDKPSIKRKHPSDGEDNNPQSPLLHHKRRRCSTLEQGFADLTLDNSQLIGTRAYPQAHSHHHELRAMDTNFDVSSSSVIRPGSIEEPAPIQEIKMKNSSWYEPEKDRKFILTWIKMTISTQGDHNQVSL